MLNLTEHQDVARQFYPRLGYTLTGDEPCDLGRDHFVGKTRRRPV